MYPSQFLPSSGFQTDVNIVPARDVYPTSAGGGLGDAASAMNGASNVASPSGGAAVAANTNVINTSGRSVWWWVGLIGLLFVLIFVARRTGTEEDFRNIRPTGYNFLAITLTSIIGIVGLKILAARFPIPGASDVIMAA